MEKSKKKWGFLRVSAVTSAVIFLLITAISGGYVLATNNPVQQPKGLTFVRTGNFDTRYESWGKPSATQIVLIHGAFESTYYFRPLAQILSKKFHVEAYDIKGFGYTQRQSPYTVASDAKQLSDFLKARKLDHPILVGHSLGAGVIAQFLFDHPKAAAGFIFLDGDGIASSRGAGDLINYLPDPYVTAVYRFATRESIVIPAIFKTACGSTCPSLTPAQINNIQLPFQMTHAQDALFELAQQPIAGVSTANLFKLRSLSIPRAVIFGAQDTEFVPETPEEIANYIGTAKPTLISGAGHLSMWAQPQKVADAIFTFIASSK